MEKILAAIPEGQREFNLDRFHAGETRMEEALLAARTLPFLSPRRIVLLRSLGKVKAGSEDASPLTEGLDELEHGLVRARPASHDSRKTIPNPSATLVVSMTSAAVRFSSNSNPSGPPVSK